MIPCEKKFNLLLWPHPIPGDQDWIKFESKLCKNFGLTDQMVFENSVSISFLYSYVKMHISNLTPLNFWVFWLTSLNLHSVRMISNNFRINRSKVLIKVLCINLFFFIFHKFNLLFWPHPIRKDYDFNNFKSTLCKDEFTQVSD